MSFLNRIARGEHLLDRNGKQFDTRPQEAEIARQITELHKRMDGCERRHVHADCDGPVLRRRVAALEKSIELNEQPAVKHLNVDRIDGDFITISRTLRKSSDPCDYILRKLDEARSERDTAIAALQRIATGMGDGYEGCTGYRALRMIAKRAFEEAS